MFMFTNSISIFLSDYSFYGGLVMSQERLDLLEKNQDHKRSTIVEDKKDSSELRNDKNLDSSSIANGPKVELNKNLDSSSIANGPNVETTEGEKNNDSSKYWIHKFPLDLLKNLEKEKKLGALKERSNKLDNFSQNDKIIIFTNLNSKICFIAYTMVEEIVESDEPLYKTFLSPKKLSLKGIKYFPKPIFARALASKLNFVENTERSANYYMNEFREISQDDFKTIIKGISLFEKYPAYLEKEISFSLDDFIKHTIKVLYGIIKSTENQHQIEIKTFLHSLKVILDEYGIKKSSHYLENFYAMNAYKFGFKHNPSRDPDKSVFLFNSAGSKRKFGYISLVD